MSMLCSKMERYQAFFVGNVDFSALIEEERGVLKRAPLRCLVQNGVSQVVTTGDVDSMLQQQFCSSEVSVIERFEERISLEAVTSLPVSIAV